MRTNILEYYSDLAAPISTKKDRARWQIILDALSRLKLLSPAVLAPTRSPSQ